MKKLNVAVIGVGFWGKNHVRIYDHLPNAELKAVCDRDRDRVCDVTKRYDVDGYTDSSLLLKREDIDAVSICTWSTELAKEASKALNAGKHVLVEKPMAANSIEAEKIVKLSEDNGLYLMVGFIERFNPGVLQIKEFVERGKVGKVVSAFSRRVSRWPERIGDIGIVKDTAIHDLDLFNYLFGGNPVGVYARVGNLRLKRFEDYAQIMIRYEDGVTCFVEANWLTPYKIRQLVITGSEAVVNLDYISQKIILESSGERVESPHEWREPLLIELSYFVDSVLKAQEPVPNGLDGVKALKIAEAALESSRKNKVIEVSFT